MTACMWLFTLLIVANLENNSIVWRNLSEVTYRGVSFHPMNVAVAPCMGLITAGTSPMCLHHLGEMLLPPWRDACASSSMCLHHLGEMLLPPWRDACASSSMCLHHLGEMLLPPWRDASTSSPMCLHFMGEMPPSGSMTMYKTSKDMTICKSKVLGCSMLLGYAIVFTAIESISRA